MITAPTNIRDISLTDLLKVLGHHPESKSGNEIYYPGILQKDRKATFLVNQNLNVWFDKALGKGGNILDFVLTYWPDLSVGEVNGKIRSLFQKHAVTVASQELGITSTDRPKRKRMAVKIPHYNIEEIKPLGYNAEITQFLKANGLWYLAANLIKEVYYFVTDSRERRKDFFAAGWANENGGWEVRGRNFSGCLGHTGLSHIPGEKDRVIVFQDFGDYLNYKYQNPVEATVFVLNSLKLLPVAQHRVSRFSEVSILFSGDENGQRAAQQLLDAIPHAQNLSDTVNLAFPCPVM